MRLAPHKHDSTPCALRFVPFRRVQDVEQGTGSADICRRHGLRHVISYPSQSWPCLPLPSGSGSSLGIVVAEADAVVQMIDKLGLLLLIGANITLCGIALHKILLDPILISLSSRRKYTI